MKMCCVFNYASHYRRKIFELIEKELNADFYFGKTIEGNIKTIEYSNFCNIKGFMDVYRIGPILYYKPFLSLISKGEYTHYLITGEPRNLSLWILLVYCRLFSKKKVCLWTHGWYGREKGLQKVIKRIFFKLPNQIFVYGEYAKEIMIKERIINNKITPIFNSLDYDLHQRFREKCKEDSGIFEEIFLNKNRTISYIGRVQSIKKIDLVIRAIYILKQKGTLVNFLVIGTGKYEKNLKQLAEHLGVEKQIFLYGECYDESIISKFIYNSCLVVSPGNIGLTAIHALSYGTPALTHSDFSNQMPEFEAIVPDYTGDFFIKDDVKDLAEKINKWTLLGNNSQYRSEIRDNCYGMIDEIYNPYNQIEILKEYLKNEGFSS